MKITGHSEFRRETDAEPISRHVGRCLFKDPRFRNPFPRHSCKPIDSAWLLLFVQRKADHQSSHDVTDFEIRLWAAGM